MQKINLRKFRKQVAENKSAFKRFLTKLEKNPPRGLDRYAAEADASMWAETDCLSCANCCKTMSPTFNKQDLKRISAHVGMTVEQFKIKYLRLDKEGDWINRKQPCQFLNLKDNKCSIYAVRPKDCAGFPHHTRKRMVDYMHVFKQNIEYCPATYRVVELMKEKLG
ncbi:MAG: YkgJ family cysteine cluster protein [Chitinophagaceae bacterium]|nr:YkgJ family cysteine cluster protein [Chitinophagaceae bacterium]